MNEFRPLCTTVKDYDLRVILAAQFPNMLVAEELVARPRDVSKRAMQPARFAIFMMQQVELYQQRVFRIKVDDVQSPILEPHALELWCMLQWPDYFRRR